jgi:hypothetical protein
MNVGDVQSIERAAAHQTDNFVYHDGKITVVGEMSPRLAGKIMFRLALHLRSGLPSIIGR